MVVGRGAEAVTPMGLVGTAIVLNGAEAATPRACVGAGASFSFFFASVSSFPDSGTGPTEAETGGGLMAMGSPGFGSATWMGADAEGEGTP